MNSRNHTKMPKPLIFVNKKFKIEYVKDKDIAKLGIIVIIEGNIEVLPIAYLI